MSGHSKWSKVKHQKAVTDAVKASSFTRSSRAITIAVREGGGITDPAKNFRLRLAVDKARQVNMPKDTIERAILKGVGTGSELLTAATYGAYGPGQVAYLIDSLTDNPNRTVSAVKNILDHNGGRMVDRGAVSHFFEPKGVIRIAKTASTYDSLLLAGLECGAEDIVDDPDSFTVVTGFQSLAKVKDYFESSGIPVDSFEPVMKPVVTQSVDAKTEEKVYSLAMELEELDDIQKVHVNAVSGDN